MQYVVPPGAALAKAKELAGADRAQRAAVEFRHPSALPRIQDLAHDDGLFLRSLMAALTQTSAAERSSDRLTAFLEKRAAPLTAATDKNPPTP